MVGRGPGAVGCAHCKVIGASVACRVCARLVCPRCEADWATCDEPSGRVVRLGLTARLRDVDPAGRLGLVSRWRGALRLFDLRRLRWIRDVEVPRTAWTFGRRYPPRLTSTARVLYPRFAWASGGQDPQLAFQGIAHGPLGGHASLVDAPVPSHGTGVSAAEDVYWYVAETQVVVTIAPVPVSVLPEATAAIQLAAPPTDDVVTVRTLNPLPRKVIQAAHVDAQRGLLASGTWGEVALHRIDGARLANLGSATTRGDLVWIAVAGPYLAACVVHDGTELLVWRLEDDLSLGELVRRHHDRRRLRAASLSRGGRYLAVAHDSDVIVHALDTGGAVTFGEHTDGIGLVRFAGDDHVLITADHDNRVVLRPRTATGYADVVVPIDVSDDELDLTVDP